MSARISIPLLLFAAGLQAQVVAVANGASFRTDQPVTPGSWATLLDASTNGKAAAFPGVTKTTAPAPVPIPKTLGGVTVTIDTTDAPVYYVSDTQINFLIPYSVTPGVHPVTVKTPGGTVKTTVRVATSAPGIFIDNFTSTPPGGAILNEDYAVNDSSHPAQRGHIIQVFATGPGALSKTLDDGAAAPTPPIETTSTPQVFIDGVEARIQFSGLAPGFAGLWQINAYVPDKSFVTGRVPIQVFMDGVDSNEVSVFVQP